MTALTTEQTQYATKAKTAMIGIAKNTLELGRILVAAKKHLPHGQFLPMLESINIATTTAQTYMNLSKLEIANTPNLGLLINFNNTRLQKLDKMEVVERDEIIASGKFPKVEAPAKVIDVPVVEDDKSVDDNATYQYSTVSDLVADLVEEAESGHSHAQKLLHAMEECGVSLTDSVASGYYSLLVQIQGMRNQERELSLAEERIDELEDELREQKKIASEAMRGAMFKSVVESKSTASDMELAEKAGAKAGVEVKKKMGAYKLEGLTDIRGEALQRLVARNTPLNKTNRKKLEKYIRSTNT